jgi:hypothetical protein
VEKRRAEYEAWQGCLLIPAHRRAGFRIVGDNA